MKISEILKQRGLFAKDIKQRFQQRQIKINDEIVDDIDISIHQIFDGADWLFSKLFTKCKGVSKNKLNFFITLVGVDGLFNGGSFSNSDNELPFDIILSELQVLRG